MKATVIDTLRYANRLKKAGVETGQAEAMSRALNDELTGGLATKADLDNAVATTKADLDNALATKADLDNALATMKADLDDAVSELNGRVNALDAKFEVKFAAVEARFAAQDGKFEGIDAKFAAIDGKFAAVDARFDAVDTKFDALRGQNRYLLLVLALIAGLGLYNATAPHLLGRVGQVPATDPVRSAPDVHAPNAGANAADAVGASPNG